MLLLIQLYLLAHVRDHRLEFRVALSEELLVELYLLVDQEILLRERAGGSYGLFEALSMKLDGELLKAK